jgi:hypothetical protein
MIPKSLFLLNPLFVFSSLFPQIIFSRLAAGNDCFQKHTVFIIHVWDKAGISVDFDYSNFLVRIFFLVRMVHDFQNLSLLKQNGDLLKSQFSIPFEPFILLLVPSYVFHVDSISQSVPFVNTSSSFISLSSNAPSSSTRPMERMDSQRESRECGNA